MKEITKYEKQMRTNKGLTILFSVLTFMTVISAIVLYFSPSAPRNVSFVGEFTGLDANNTYSVQMFLYDGADQLSPITDSNGDPYFVEFTFTPDHSSGMVTYTYHKLQWKKGAVLAEQMNSAEFDKYAGLLMTDALCGIKKDDIKIDYAAIRTTAEANGQTLNGNQIIMSASVNKITRTVRRSILFFVVVIVAVLLGFVKHFVGEYCDYRRWCDKAKATQKKR